MRTSRLSLAGTVILMLAGGVVAVGAEAEEAPASEVPHGVSGDLEYVADFTSRNNTEAEWGWLQRDYGSYDAIRMDDTRLSGTLWHVWNRDLIWGSRKYYTDGEVLTGTAELINNDGSWIGTMRGYVTEPGASENRRTHHWHIELTGTGAYEGLSALLRAWGKTHLRVEGFVFPGALPEYPDPVEVPE